MIEKEVEKDWWNQLPQKVRSSVFEALDDIEKVKVFTNDQVFHEAK